MRNEQGFTLIEVVVSLLIITIVLLSFSQLFLTNNKHANTNTEKLIVVNLADAQLERLRVTASKLDLGTSNSFLNMNGKTYEVKVEVSQTDDERKMNIQNVFVTVKAPESNLSTTVEGYVTYAETE